MTTIGPRPSPLGSMAARINPPLHVPYSVPDAKPLRDRLMIALVAFPRTTSGLASELDVKELAVIQSLANLEQEGLVVRGPVPAEGRRGQCWGLA